MSQLTAIRLLDADEPAGPLLEAVLDLAEGKPNQAIYQVKPASFRQVPNAPFAYWVSNDIRKLFATHLPLENERLSAKVGLQSGDNFRFVRTNWEVYSSTIDKTWYPLAKGGGFSPFYADLHLLANWANGGIELHNFCDSEGKTIGVLRNTKFYFLPGLTWTHRTSSRISFRTLQKGCVFDQKGPSILMNNGSTSEMMQLLGCVSSSIFLSLVEFLVGAADAAARSYDCGIINKIPLPDLKKTETIADRATSAWSTKRSTDTGNQTSHAFYAPALSPGQFGSRNKKATTA